MPNLEDVKNFDEEPPFDTVDVENDDDDDDGCVFKEPTDVCSDDKGFFKFPEEDSTDVEDKEIASDDWEGPEAEGIALIQSLIGR